MLRLRTLRLVFTTMALMLAVGAASAPARELRFSNRNIRATWRQLRVTNMLTSVQCPVTLEGSFHATAIGKAEGNLIGYITRAVAGTGECIGGSMTFLGFLPWHVKYERFVGTLPNISSILLQIINLEVRTTRETFNCLYRSTAAAPLLMSFLLGAGGQVTGARVIETVLIRKEAPSSAFCGEVAEVVGTGTVALLNTVNAISITLI